MAVSNFSFDNEEAQSYSSTRPKKMKFEVRKYRCALAWFETDQEGEDDLSRPRFMGGQVHGFKEGLGYVFRSDDGETESLLGPASPRVVTWLMIYATPPTDTDKVWDVERVVPWVLTASKMNDLMSLNAKAKKAGYPSLGAVDFEINCKESKFQRLEYDLKDECWILDPKNRKARAKFARAVARESRHAEGLLGRKMSMADIREKLGMSAPEEDIDTSSYVDDSDQDLDI